jgi:hypothetical protein
MVSGTAPDPLPPSMNNDENTMKRNEITER